MRQYQVHRLLSGTVVLLGLIGCAEETVAHRQGERQANRILVLLRTAGISAKKIPDLKARKLRFHVVVKERDVSESLVILEKHNLPEQERLGTAESFGAGGMIPTAEHERAKRIVGVEGDIVNAFRKIPRVISAEAAVSIPQIDPLRSDVDVRPRPKASIILVYLTDTSTHPPISIEEVQKHVQAKLPELKSREVNVLLLASPHASSEHQNTSEISPQEPEFACSKRDYVLGIYVCAGERWKILAGLITFALAFGLMASLVVISSLRMRRYRQDLSRLTLKLPLIES
ncbi:MAG: hypothetical protein KTR25_09290 [Myxococcales bacterium]|nr:hypothetical protein [Myxococcales bacterium]